MYIRYTSYCLDHCMLSIKAPGACGHEHMVVNLANFWFCLRSSVHACWCSADVCYDTIASVVAEVEFVQTGIRLPCTSQSGSVS